MIGIPKKMDLSPPQALQFRRGLRRFQFAAAAGHSPQHFFGSTADTGAAEQLGLVMTDVAIEDHRNSECSQVFPIKKP